MASCSALALAYRNSSSACFLEEKALELKREMVAGQERVVWNPTLSIPAKDFEFTDPEVARLKAAIQLWDSYGVAAERRWLQPLVEILFPTNPASLPLKP